MKRIEPGRWRWRLGLVLLALGAVLACNGTNRGTEPPPPAPGCPGLCYQDLPDGGCESLPTCCPVTHPHSATPHCPQGYILDMNPQKQCGVQHICVD